ncbi:DUF4010 domain-containing protein [Sandaracinobacter sp. RS1-74]|uniref:MgtC/SapB family protein n=1 Tax=Sandaracinobacteroides sayramensis TaxID=2913411 RepID=UPI001EDBF19A|nr:DUF4010 domain-containing protein [Sandaracinobacteroides sayramensis]MCG2842467.1 DUF4010 domain-containing protein [Sandaracinobacteroides sayramensis]
METVPLLQPLGHALAIGLLVGLERGWQARDAPSGHRVAGFRTFGLLGLAGGLAALLAPLFGAILFAAAMVALLIGYVRESNPEDLSVTGTVAGLLTLGLGGLAASGQHVAAYAATAVVVLLLAMRRPLHRFLRGIARAEIDAASRFAIVALVILPLMPDRMMGPYDAWNPRSLWTVVVLVSGFSFLGYVTARRVGAEKGLLATAAAGALVSSTAVSVSYARRLRQESPAEGALVAGISLASAVMFARALVLTAILIRPALPSLALLLAPALAVQLALAWRAVRKSPSDLKDGDVELGNPLDFGPALLLAGFVALLAVASRWALDEFGNMGIGLVMLITGLADVDAAIITLAQFPEDLLTPRRAGALLLLPALANTAVKAILILSIAPNARGWRAAWPLLASLAASAAALPFLLGL